MLTSDSNNKHFPLVPDFKRKVYGFSSIKYDICLRILVDNLYQIRLSSIHICIQILIMNIY